jgi:hypothetical protein
MRKTWGGVTVCAILLAAVGSAAADPTEIRRLGLGMRGGGAAAPDGHFLVDWALDTTWRPWSHIGLGAELSGGRVSLVEGPRNAFGVAPHVEYVQFARPWLELFGRTGVPLQTRSGGGVDGSGGLAIYGAAGARYWPECYESGPELATQVGCLSFGVEVRALHALDGGYLVMPAVLPEGTTVLMTSFSIGVEL